MKKILFFLAFMAIAIISPAQPWLIPGEWSVDSNSTVRVFSFFSEVSTPYVPEYHQKGDTIKPITSWDTTGYKHIVFQEPEDDGTVLVFKQMSGDTLSVFDPVLKLWVPTNKVLVPRSKAQYRQGPLFKARPKGTRKQVADAMMITAVVGYFITGYHAGAAERELSNEGWPRNKSSHVYRDVSIWGDAGFGAMWGASIAINWNQELHGKTLLRAALSAIACGGLRYAGTRLGYYNE